MALFNLFSKKKSNEQEKKDTALTLSKNSLTVKGLTIHEDLKKLVWIGDGPYKNYTSKLADANIFEFYGYKISISFMKQEEPSLIFTKHKVDKPVDENKIDRPPYYPTYSGLTPEQKWVYLKLLSNPYDSSINIGFVFILYYGLERHLLHGNFKEAFNVILKLRDVHTNKSFQSYSANALILSCMLRQHGEFVLDFIKSLDKEHELHFSDNLFLICYYSFNIPLLPKDLIRIAKSFEFTNNNYIRKYPDLFLECLKTSIIKKLGTDKIDLKHYLTKSDINKVKLEDVNIFANMSIIEKSVPIPLLTESFKLKREMYNFLETAHENVKTKLAEMKKSGKALPSQEPPKKKKKELHFDIKQEKFLLEELSKNKNNPVSRHFTLISLQDFYYKYRELNTIYIEKCIEYCLMDINNLDAMKEAYIDQEINRVKQIASFYGPDYLENETLKIKKRGFIGSIPAYTRLAIIYEKKGEFNKAIDICDQAIKYGEAISSFKERNIKLKNKLNQ